MPLQSRALTAGIRRCHSVRNAGQCHVSEEPTHTPWGCDGEDEHFYRTWTQRLLVLPSFAERLRMDWMNISNIPTLYPSWKLSSRRQKVHDGMVKLQQGSSHNGWPTYCHPSNGCYICSLSPPKLHPGPIRWVKRTAKGQDLGFMQCNHAIPIQLDTHHLIRNKGSFRCLFRKSCDE